MKPIIQTPLKGNLHQFYIPCLSLTVTTLNSSLKIKEGEEKNNREPNSSRNKTPGSTPVKGKRECFFSHGIYLFTF